MSTPKMFSLVYTVMLKTNDVFECSRNWTKGKVSLLVFGYIRQKTSDKKQKLKIKKKKELTLFIPNDIQQLIILY